MNDIGDLLDSIPQEKRSLLGKRLKVAGGASTSTQIIPRPATSLPTPLSFAQQRLWFLAQLAPDSPHYNVSKVMRLKGMLDVAALEKALNEIVRRHEALRTTFVATDGIPAQVIADSASVVMTLIDLRGTPEAKREAETRRLVTDEVRRPFNLSTELLLRATLLRTRDEEEFVFILVLHHIASDGWSLGVLLRELTILYQAFLIGSPSSLPELSIQFADFALWQREWLQGETLNNQLVYWKRQLDGAPTLSELPTDRPRLPLQTFAGAQASMSFSGNLTELLRALSRQERATLFMTLLAAFKALLHRYTSQDDIVVGSPIAGRTRIEIEPLIGFFVNTLVLRTDLSGDPTFRELLARVRETALGAYAHQDVPFEKLVEELQPERSLSHTPLFQTMFALQNTPKQALELPGITLSGTDVESAVAKFDLVCYMTEEAGGLCGRLEYNTDLFDAATIDRMLHHFRSLLQGIVAAPDRKLSELPLLSDAERHQLLVGWNDTKTDYPRNRSIHELFESQAGRTPDAVAVTSEAGQLTYDELNRKANRLAHRLRTLGVQPETLVGICMERSTELIVGMLAVLKAGGAYVPLDPMYPEERLAFMLEDTRTPVLLTQEKLKESLPGHAAQVVVVDADEEEFERRSEANLGGGTEAGDLAYVMYTSGSTGQPKGIAVPHRAVIRLVSNTNYVELDAFDRIAQISNASFDAATFEIWGALLNGACLVLIAKEVILSPPDFARHIRAHQISVMFLTTALFNQLAGIVPEAFGSVNSLLFGGEAVDPKWVDEVLRSGPPKRLLHVYGPTENTTFTSWHLVRDRSGEAATIPIGRPISNTRLYVLDPHRQLVPVGVAGELYVSGDGLARGYLNHPELTDERFIPDPFGGGPGARLYKTGDRVRYLPDGSLEFLGRLDRQVKVRGFRIEPEEIEAVLNLHGGVRESVVVAREDEPGDKRLVAYVAARQKQTSEHPSLGDELRRYVSRRLPDYMMPVAFVVLEALPITPNGKVDRRALPMPERTCPEQLRDFVAPRDPLERQIADVWEEVLGIAPIGVHENFFTLGGHSLLAVRMMSMIEQNCGKKLPLADLFEEATISHLGRCLLRRRDEKFQSGLVPVQPNGSRRPFFFLHGDFNGGGFYCSKLAEHLGETQPFYALQPHGLGEQQIPATIEEMAADYVETLRRFQPEGPYLLGGFCHGGLIAFEMARRLRQQNQRVDLLILIYASARNVRYRFQHLLVNNLGRLFRLKPGTQLDFFIRSRVFSKHLHDLPRAKRIIFLLRKLRSLMTRSGQPKTNGKREELAAEESSKIPTGDSQRHNKELLTKYRRAVQGYVPGKYPASLHLFWPEDEAVQPDDLTMSWREVATRVTVHTVPGEHLSCVTTHIQSVAEKVKDCLDEAQAPEFIDR